METANKMVTDTVSTYLKQSIGWYDITPLTKVCLRSDLWELGSSQSDKGTELHYYKTFCLDVYLIH